MARVPCSSLLSFQFQHTPTVCKRNSDRKEVTNLASSWSREANGCRSVYHMNGDQWYAGISSAGHTCRASSCSVTRAGSWRCGCGNTGMPRRGAVLMPWNHAPNLEQRPAASQAAQDVFCTAEVHGATSNASFQPSFAPKHRHERAWPAAPDEPDWEMLERQVYDASVCQCLHP